MSRRAALLWCLATAATLCLLQIPAAESQTRVARVGVVHVWWPLEDARAVSEFRKRLAELGWVEGRNLVIEERWTEGRSERLPSLMREVLDRNVDVLMTYSTPGAVAAKNATATVPIVVALMGDPVTTGLASSLASPGGNVTGLSGGFGQGFCGKWLELAQESVPKLNTVAVLTNPDHPLARPFRQEIEAIAPSRALKTKFIEVREPAALDRAFQQARQSAQAVLVLPGSLTFQNRRAIAALALKYRLPSIYANQESVEAGGLIAYGVDFAVLFRRAADYVDKILKGAKPAELPIEEPTQFRLAINLRTARALGLTMPDSVLLRADEVVR